MAPRRVWLGVFTAMAVLAAIAGPAGAVGRAERDTAQRDAVVRAAAADLESRSGAYVHTAGPGSSRESVTQLLSGIRNYRDTDVWLGAVAQAAAATTGVQPLVAAPAAEAAEEPDEDAPYTGAFAETADAGDLDGDGLSDVVAYHWDVQSWAVVMEARSGKTGDVLWERTADADGGLAWPLTSDMDGDGAADLLIFDLQILTDSWDDCDWETEDDCWSRPWEMTFQWQVGMLSGRDASVSWNRVLDGWISESFDEGAEPSPGLNERTFRYEIAGENVGILPFFADIKPGGGDETILNAIDITERAEGNNTFVWGVVAEAGTSEGSTSLTSTTRANVIDAAGQGVQSFVAQGGRVSLLWPLAHPDGSADLVWEHAVYPESRWECGYAYILDEGAGVCPVDEHDPEGVEIEVFDGATLQRRWTTTIPGWGFAWPVGGDLDDDGRTDVATWTMDWEAWEDRTVLLSGATGAALWGDDVVIRDVLAVGPLDSTGGVDALTIDYDETYSDVDGSYSATVYFQRRDGATGALLHQTAHSMTDSGSAEEWVIEMLYATVGDDGSGDGALELTVGKVTLTLHEDEEDFSFEYGPSSAVAESGATGETLYRLDHDGYALLLMGPDFNGDGLADALAQMHNQGADSDSARISPIRLTDGTGLWTEQVSGDYVFYSWGGDADDDGGGEVYRHVDTVDQPQRRISTQVAALSGGTGLPRWTYSSRP